MLRTFVHIFALAICGILPSLAFGWGDAGHHIVCEIAWQELDAETRAKVGELLAGDVDRTFAKSCSWADRVLRRRDPSFDRYHYVNVPEGAERVPPCEGKCVVDGIDEFARVLGDLGAPRRDRVLALKLVGHLVGDIHQPLHAGYASDRGGNEVSVELLGRKTNLHAAWDTGVLQSFGRDWQAQARELAAGIRTGDRRLWRGSPRDWAEESFALVEGLVYDGIPALDDAYVARIRPRLEERLQAAGVRLAALLRRTLAGDPPRIAKAQRLRVVSAQFGLIEPTATGAVTIRETTEIPRVAGVTFGWMLAFDLPDREVAWREELVLSAPPLSTGGAKQVTPRKLVREGRVPLDQGRLTQQWTLDAGDPIGTHRIRVYVDGRLAKSFRFSTYIPQAATPIPSLGTAASPGACIPRAQCCKVCSTGQACGATCISRSYTCRTGQGCACDAAEVCR